MDLSASAPRTDSPPNAIPIPAYSPMDIQPNAVAGPSSEGAIPRAPNDSDAPMQQPFSPSSAPPVPSAIAVTHPSQFIHTHHPRRGSQTPLGLNVISPVVPSDRRDRDSLPSRNVGFHPNYTPDAASMSPSSSSGMGFTPMSSSQASRRDSAASTTSTLTLSRPTPAASAQPSQPNAFLSGRRRSSLTPSLSSLAPAHPTHTHANGKPSRPISVDDKGMESGDYASGSLWSAARSDMYARRGSLPYIGMRGMAGNAHRSWSPVLPPPRGSFDRDKDPVTLPDAGYKFGSAVSSSTFAPYSGSPSPAGKKSRNLDVFEQAEVDEAERQRRAFMAATFGADGQRARERLSIGGQSGPGLVPGGTRRQSLMLWDRMGMARGSGDESTMSAPVGYTDSSILTGSPSAEAEIGPRRGSLPIAIPGSGGLGRSSSRREYTSKNQAGEDSEAGFEKVKEGEDEDDEDEEVQGRHGPVLAPPVRPLPPLMPLSDPGPRLLPSTLALHRANHLLNSRNLQSDPLPPPLPPSLHPPDPVDVTEFDIDFILAGSQAQLGHGTSLNAPVDILGGQGEGSLGGPAFQTFKLGGDDEDTFAKFVGEFDDEYGGRRGEWTFRSCAAASPLERAHSRDPFDTTGSDDSALKAEWESSGAGKYEIFTDGQVRSKVTGRSWMVRRTGLREYEMEEVKDWSLSAPGRVGADERYTLAGKTVHRDQGGVKLPYFSIDPFFPTPTSRSTPAVPSGSRASKTRASMSEGVPQSKIRAAATPSGSGRAGSDDSSATVTLSQSVPFSNTMAAIKAKKKEDRERVARDDILFPSMSSNPSSKKIPKNKDVSKDIDEKKDRSLGGVLKRGLLSSIKNSGLVGSFDERKHAREERERERIQAHSWSGSSSSSGHHGWSPHSQRAKNALGEKHSRSHSTGVDPLSSRGENAMASHVEEDAQMQWVEGKAWDGVPEDAVAMVIPLEGEASMPGIPATAAPLQPQSPSASNDKDPLTLLRSPDGKIVPHPFFCSQSKQAMLVWYVPFNSEYNDDARPSTASSKSSSTDSPGTSTNETSAMSVSLPKFQKLLRRRTSKDKDALKRDVAQGQSQPRLPDKGTSANKVFGQALPFRSFRVVARVVDSRELKSQYERQKGDDGQGERVEWPQDGTLVSESSTETADPLEPSKANPAGPPFLSVDPPSDDSIPRFPSGRNFTTVIAVCHSRSQGVEFVLEGLDRLGLCKGESAWGPTGYEEWRGTGLSDHGRKLLDLLWAGCTGVMGLCGS